MCLSSGQSLAALAQPYMMFASTKVAALWFPEEHRALANTIGSMGMSNINKLKYYQPVCMIYNWFISSLFPNYAPMSAWSCLYSGWYGEAESGAIMYLID